jgi:uncharacterized secreted protein with C-terminal beta-propeller domain
MKKLIFIFFISVNILFASLSIPMKKGWQFMGFPSTVEDLSIFNNRNVGVIWGFDAVEQKWVGYAPEEDVMKRIREQYAPLKEIAAWQGVWIYNHNDWILELDDTDSTESMEMTLHEGWNMVSLPNNITVSPDFFGETASVWAYHGEQWYFASPLLDTEAVPPVKEIGSAEAVWVKSGKTHTISLNTESSKLHTFKDRDTLERYIENMALNAWVPYRFVETGGGVPIMENQPNTQPLNSTPKTDNMTETNLQEEGVDESDILKHNNTHTFFYDRIHNVIHIRSFAALASSQVSDDIVLPLSNNILQGMYIYDKTLILILEQQQYTVVRQKQYGDMSEQTSVAEKELMTKHFELRMYDISDIQAVKKIFSTVIDGYYEESRIINGKLYLISQFHPQIKVTYPKVYIDKTECQGGDISVMTIENGHYIPECSGIFSENGRYYRYDYDHPIISQKYLLPLRDGGRSPFVIPEKFYAPYKLDQYPQMTVIAKFDLQTHRFEGTVATVNGTERVYVSSDTLYLTSANYPSYIGFSLFYDRETIYKFSLGEEMDYQAKGTVDGKMLNEFSMSERDGYLRLATTSEGWDGNGLQNRLYILRQDGESLVETGRLEGLGKEGERIKGIRFIGEKAYIVTFRQKDPLYLIDLHDPFNPQVSGSLQVDGFSSYIHPVGDRYLLTLGRDADETGNIKGFMIQLYDVTNPSVPRLSDLYHYSDTLYDFDAEYQHQAFIYRESDNLFAVTYRDEKDSLMDIFYADTVHGKIIKLDQLQLPSVIYERRGMVFDYRSQTYGTLFCEDKVVSKEIRRNR